MPLSPAAKLKRQRSRLTRQQMESAKVLSEWNKEARRRATLLRTDLVWALLYEQLTKARRLGLEQELRAICWQHAGQMADPRMLRLTARYGKR